MGKKKLMYVLLGTDTDIADPNSFFTVLESTLKPCKRFSDSTDYQKFIRRRSLSQRMILVMNAAALDEFSLNTHDMIQILRVFAYYDGEESNHQLQPRHKKVKNDQVTKREIVDEGYNLPSYLGERINMTCGSTGRVKLRSASGAWLGT